jgi:hypothetical protein|tara:strand:- start:40 stop:348 length:309 start_codon:yes stop_codon:yes gene_type:complete
MTIKNIIDQVELLYGRQSHAYITQLVNDAMLDIASKKQHYVKEVKVDLTSGKRWYDLPAECIDIVRIEVLDTNSRYNLVPKLADYHKLLKSDADDAGTGDVS